MRKIIRKTLLILAGLLTLMILGIAILLNFVFTPAKITPAALKIINENVEANVSCESIELTFFSSFPFLKARLKNGLVLATGSQGDTLGSFREFSGTINLRDLVLNHNINIRRAKIINPTANIIFDKNGRSNWEILKESEPYSTGSSDYSFSFNQIKLKELVIEQASFNYVDSAMNMSMSAPAFDLRLNAVTDSNKIAMRLMATGKNISLIRDSVQLVKHLDAELSTELNFDKIKKELHIPHGNLSVNHLDFDLNGKLAKKNDHQQLEVDLTAALKVHSLDSLFRSIPNSMLPLENARIGGMAHFDFISKGTYGEGELPVTQVSLKIERGSLSYKDYPGKIESLEADLNSVLDFKRPEHSTLHIGKLLVKGTGISIDGQGTVTQLLADPIISARLKSEIDLTSIKKMFPLEKGMDLGGNAKLALTGKAHFKPAEGIDYNNLDLDGEIELNALHVRMKHDSIIFNTGITRLNARNKGMNALSGKLDIDSISLEYQQNQRFFVSDLHMSFQKETQNNQRYPVSARFTVQQLRYSGADSLAGNLQDAVVHLRLQPNDDFSASSIRTVFSMKNVSLSKGKLQSISKDGFFNAHDHKLTIRDLKATLTRRPRSDRKGTLKGSIGFSNLQYVSSDSLKLRIKEAAINADLRQNGRKKAPTILSSLDVQHISLKKSSDLFVIKNGHYELSFKKDSTRDWWPNGSVAFTKFIAYLPAIGLPLSIEDSRIDVSDHSVILDKARIRAGHSRLQVSGSLSQLYTSSQANKVPVKASLSVSSPYIDANELMSSIHKASTLVSSFESEEELPVTDTLSITSTEKTVFELPKDINFGFDVSIDTFLFGDLVLENIKGKAKLENGRLLLPSISFNSAEARVQARLRYAPVSPQSARVNYSLKIQNLEMSHLKDLAPSLDTLFPVAKSMEGKANFNIRGMAMLNEHLEPDMKTVKSVALLEAHHIQVGKSEAFKELAKTFMFKNKEQTEIDSLNIEMLLNDSKLEILPALVEIDRYQLAVGGIQHIDLSYTYHVSVLKSQIPFKTGVDIKGTVPSYDISLAKAKYKYFFSDKAKQQDKADKDILEKRKFILEKLDF